MSTYGWNKPVTPKVSGMGRSRSAPPAHPLLLPGCWRRVSLCEYHPECRDTAQRKDNSSLGLSQDLASSPSIRWEGFSGDPLSSLLRQGGLVSGAGCWHVSAHSVVPSPRVPGHVEPESLPRGCPPELRALQGRLQVLQRTHAHAKASSCSHKSPSLSPSCRTSLATGIKINP